MVNATKSGYGPSEGNVECRGSKSESTTLALVKHFLRDESAGVERLIAHGVQVADPLLQPPPIVLAALRTDHDMARLLVANGANVDAGMSMPNVGSGVPASLELMNGKRAMHFAAWYGDWNLVKILLQAGANPDIADANGVTPLMHASEGAGERAGIARLLLEERADPTLPCRKGYLALHVAAQHGCTKTVRVLVTEAPHTLFDRTLQGGTPLYLAAYEGQWQTVSYLLSVAQLHGVTFAAQSTKECPLMAAVVQGCLRGRSNDDEQPRPRGPSQHFGKVVSVLLDSGRGVLQRKDLISGRARCIAILGGRADILQQLLDVDGEERRTQWARSSFRCKSMLHYAVAFSRLSCVNALLMAGADEGALDGQMLIPDDYLGSLTIEGYDLLLPRIHVSDFPEVDKDHAMTSAIGSMLERGPAYRARSWAHPAFGEPRAGALDQNRATCSATAKKNVSPMHVRIFRRQGSTRLPIKSFAAAVDRFCWKD